MRLWIKDPLAILARAGAERGVVVEGTRIVECVGRGQSPDAPWDVTFNASRHVVLPGLVNAHHHFYQTLTRAHPNGIGKELIPWLIAMEHVWGRLTPEALRIAVRMALVELLLSGCTTAADHHNLFPPGLESAIDIEVEEAIKLGLRMTVTRGSMGISEKDGGLQPDAIVQDSDTILEDSERVLRLFHDPKPGAMIRVALAPCSPLAVPKRVMEGSAALAERYDCRLHTHLCQSLDEDVYSVETFGVRSVDLLEQAGWLSSRAWVAHGIHFNSGEVERLGRTGVCVCHCAASDMAFGMGVCPVKELEAAGVTVGLGVDGSASNDSSNMMEAVRHSLMLQRLSYGPSAVTPHDALRWATEGSARCLGRDDIGRIAVGMQADLALYTLDEPRFSGAQDPIAALALCGAHRADRVMIAGRWRVIDGAPEDVDLAALIAKHKAAARAFA
jgi:8-oxoguanine deaminase